MQPNLDWIMSPAAFERDWPQPRLDAGVYYISPTGSRYGYGVALNKAAAEWQHSHIREQHVKAGRRIVWC